MSVKRTKNLQGRACLVQNVGGEELRSYASGKIFEGFSPETAFNGSVVAVGLGITLFK